MLARPVLLVLPLMLAAACAGEPAPPAPATSPVAAPTCKPGRDAPARLRLGVSRSASSAFFDDGFRPLAGHLSARLGMPVDLRVVDRYDELLDLLATGDADLAILPPLTYVHARERMPCLNLLLTMVSRGDVHYSGYLLVRQDSPIRRPADLAGKRVAFVDRGSASGYLLPLARLIADKVDPGAIDARFLGDHEAVIRAVLAGDVDAGASYFAGLTAARRKGIDTGLLRVLAVTGRVPLDAVVARPDLDPHVASQAASVLAATNGTTPEGREILSQLVDVEGFVPTDDGFYDPVRQTVAAVRAVDPGVR